MTTFSYEYALADSVVQDGSAGHAPKTISIVRPSKGPAVLHRMLFHGRSRITIGTLCAEPSVHLLSTGHPKARSRCQDFSPIFSSSLVSRRTFFLFLAKKGTQDQMCAALIASFIQHHLRGILIKADSRGRLRKVLRFSGWPGCSKWWNGTGNRKCFSLN